MWEMCTYDNNNFAVCYTDVINTISLRLRYESSENCNNGLLDRNSVEYTTLRADVIQEVQSFESFLRITVFSLFTAF